MDAVRARLDTMVARRECAGLQYLFVQDGRVRLEHAAGLADVALGLPVEPATTFNIYSITKVLTATAAVALAEAGRLDLDQPIGDAAGVRGLDAFGTVRETLMHRAGFPNPNPLRWVHLAEEHAAFDEDAFAARLLARLAGSRRIRARAAYSNPGYVMLGLAIARAGGAPFTQHVAQSLLAPLNPAAGESLSFTIADPVRHARGHVRRWHALDLLLGLFVDRARIVDGVAPGWVRLRLHHVDGSAYGGLMANVRGLARFGQALLGHSGGIGTEVRRRLLETVPGPGPARTLAFFEGRLDGERWCAHAGGGLGYYGELRLYPAAGCVSVLLLNRPGLRDAALLDRIDRPLLRELREQR
jgi:CubicO group peptidase (beta-lactamase class C family)